MKVCLVSSDGAETPLGINEETEPILCPVSLSSLGSEL